MDPKGAGSAGIFGNVYQNQCFNYQEDADPVYEQGDPDPVYEQGDTDPVYEQGDACESRQKEKVKKRLQPSCLCVVAFAGVLCAGLAVGFCVGYFLIPNEREKQLKEENSMLYAEIYAANETETLLQGKLLDLMMTANQTEEQLAVCEGRGYTTSQQFTGQLEYVYNSCSCPPSHHLKDGDTCNLALTLGDPCVTNHHGVSLLPSHNAPASAQLATQVLVWPAPAFLTSEIIAYDGSGVITSPDWPNKYKNYMNQSYLITTDPRSRIQIEFTNVSFEGPRYDYLSVYDGRNMLAPMLAKVSYHNGSYVGDKFNSSSNVFFLHFYTDHNKPFEGFRLIFESFQ